MRAFVLSGGGNRGPLEVGVVRQLLRAGIVPDMIVGTSAGAVNGLYLAIDPVEAQAEHCAALWRDAGKRKLFSDNPSQTIARMLRGKDFLADNKRLRAYMRSVLPAQVRTFADLRVPFYVTTAHLLTQTLYVFGDDHTASPIDAALLSAAVPGFFPPVHHGGELFTDGGVASNLPVLVAIARGATEIWAIDLANQPSRSAVIRGAFSISTYCGQYLLYQTVLRELERAVGIDGITLHHLPIYGHQNITLGDFSKVDAMVSEGAQVAERYLAQPRPNQIQYPKAFGPDELPAGPPGARPFAFSEIAAAQSAATARRQHPLSS